MKAQGHDDTQTALMICGLAAMYLADPPPGRADDITPARSVLDMLSRQIEAHASTSQMGDLALAIRQYLRHSLADTSRHPMLKNGDGISAAKVHMRDVARAILAMSRASLAEAGISTSRPVGNG